MKLMAKFLTEVESRLEHAVMYHKDWSHLTVKYGDNPYIDERIEAEVIGEMVYNLFRVME